jgi:hypothetical protein
MYVLPDIITRIIRRLNAKENWSARCSEKCFPVNILVYVISFVSTETEY